MNQTNITPESLANDASTELAHLRGQVEELMKERVKPALSGLATQAENAAKQASDEMRLQAERIADVVQEKPLLALGIAAAAGFLLASLIRR